MPFVDPGATETSTPISVKESLPALARRPDLGQYRALVSDAIVELDGLLQTFASLLRVSRIEMGHRTAGFGRLDLAGVAREVVDLFDPTAEEVAVRLRFCESGPASVSGDRDLLFDAIANMIDNAIKHGGSGGEVTVTVEPGGGRAGPFGRRSWTWHPR